VNRKEIIKAGVGAELFYASIYGSYRAVVRSVEPKTTHRGGLNRGVAVTLWDEDNRQKNNPSWRADVETGMRYKDEIVDAAKLKGDWKSWRTEQLAQRERDVARKHAKEAAEERALGAAIAINEAIGTELRQQLGDAGRSGFAGEYSVTMPAALAKELLGGWQWSMAQHSDPMDGEVKVKLPWRRDVTEAGVGDDG